MVQATTPPRAGDTYVLRVGEISFGRYAEGSKSGKPGALHDAHLWPALSEAAATLITYYPLEQLLEVVMDIVFRAVPAQRGALMLRRPDAPAQLDTRVVRAPTGQPRLDISQTIVQQVLEGQAVLTADALADGRFERAESIYSEGVRSILCVPLWNEREVIGLIYVDNLDSRDAFSQSDLRLLGLIANMAAVKVENARLLLAQIEQARLAEQLQVAAQIQRRLLPQVDPEVAGYEVRGLSHPCYEIGGDYYDYLWRGEERLALVVADVSGKGVGAALLMAAFQASLRTLASGEADPVALVTQLNRVITENSLASKFVTIFYAELDPSTHTLEYVNAGHNPPLCLRGTAIHKLAATGPVVGLLPDATYRSERIVLQPGELLTLYTDGITECEDIEEREFGEERLARFVLEHGHRSLDDLSRRLLVALGEFSAGTPRKDDSTLILLRRTA